jgi:cell division transport system permease protein
MNIHFKTAFSNIRRSPFQAFAAVSVLTVTFFVVSTLAVLLYSSSKLLEYFETRPQVIAFLKDEAAPADVSSFKNHLASDARIKDVKYVSKEEALSIYKDATTDNPLLSELVTPSIFPASLEFSLKDLNYAKDVINEVKNEKIVDQVGFTANLGGEATLQDTVERLRTITRYVRIGGGVFVGVLLATSFLVLFVIISMRLTARRGEIEILNLIGATSNFIRSPVLVEALTYVAIGVFLGWMLSFIMVLYLSPSRFY